MEISCPHSFGTAANDRRRAGNREWLDALAAVIGREGAERAHFLLEALDRPGAPARHRHAVLGQHRLRQHHPARPRRALARQPRASRSACARTCAGMRWRWSCAPTATSGDLGGHIASFASAATMFEVGFNHFWRAPTADHGGDLVYFQGHSSPGIYARAFLEGRLTEEQLAQLPPGSRRQGPVVVSASVADAGLLAVPDRVDGPRPADGDLPGALHALPAAPRHRQHRGPQGLGVLRRRRDGRARIAGRDRRSPRARSSTT